MWSTETSRIRLDLAFGYGFWVGDLIDQAWQAYLISLMFHQLPGPQSSILRQMTQEIYRVYGRLVTRFARNPRSPSQFNLLPRMFLFPDLPIHKKQNKSLKDVIVNDGLHFGGIVLTPPISRFRSTLDVYFHSDQQSYVNENLSRIHVEAITWNPAYVTDYVAKSIKRGRMHYDDIIILPRTTTELP